MPNISLVIWQGEQPPQQQHPLPSDLRIVSAFDQTSLFIGEVAHLRVEGSGLAPEDLVNWAFDWTTGESGSWSKMEANTPFGRDKASIFDTPAIVFSWATAGIKSVSCRVHRTGFADRFLTFQITVLDPAQTIPAANTVIVDPTGAYDGPSAWSSSTKVTTLAAAFTAIQSRGFGQILVRPGSVITGATIRLDRIATTGYVVIDSWDRSSPFTITVTTSAFQVFYGTNVQRIALRNAVIAGPYNPATGLNAETKNGIRGYQCGAIFSVVDCRIGGTNSSVSMDDSSVKTNFRAIGNDFSADLRPLGYGFGWQNFAVWIVNNEYGGLAFNRMLQSNEAINGSEGKDLESPDGNRADHGPFRFAFASGYWICIFNDMGSETGWSASSLTLFTVLAPAVQPVGRVGSEAIEAGTRILFCHNYCAGRVHYYADSDAGINGKATWIISKGNMYLGKDMEWRTFGFVTGHSNFWSANDTIIQPNVTNIFGSSALRAIEFARSGVSGNSSDWNTGIYDIRNLTLVDDRSAANVVTGSTMARYFDLEQIAAQSFAAPTITGVQYVILNRIPEGSLTDQTTRRDLLAAPTVLRNSGYTGYKFHNLDGSQTYHNTAGATPPGTVRTTPFNSALDLSPLSIDRARVPAADMFGRKRNLNRTVPGAFEPS